MDYAPYVLLLQREGIQTVHHLSMVPYSELQQLPIPLLLRYQLKEYCKPPIPTESQFQTSYLPNLTSYSSKSSLAHLLPSLDDHGTEFSEALDLRPTEITYDDFSETSCPVIVFSEFGIIEYTNPQMSTLSGYAPHDLIGKSLGFLLTPKYFNIDPVAYLKTAVKESTKIEFVRKDATTKFCSLNVSEKMRRGNMVFLVKVEVIKDTQCRYDSSNPVSLCETLTDLVIATGPDGRIHYANPRSRSITGWKPRELMGKSINILMPPDIASQHDTYLANYLRTGKKHILGSVKGVDMTLLKKDKKLCKIHLVLTEHEIGGKLHYVAVISPKEDWNRYDKLKDSTLVINKKGIIEYANHACKALTGHKPSFLVGRNIKILMTPEDGLQHDQNIKRYLTTGIKRIIGIGRNVSVLHREGTVLQVHLVVNEIISLNEIFFCWNVSTQRFF
eukprot:TRINITY_DN5871_c0_g1_i1.p1 TRINITY_DN5871_c0_g1~~TRINITY_DN5871_c0_g1_i1.p1  ORF type:complete len:445 (-),score=74.44 TRINITY_DN5871_c0_g1_i1:73-1407(-)